MKNMKKVKKGFTLPELLVVVAIITILATILVPIVSRKVELAKVATAKAEIRHLAQAEETCAIDTGYYVALRVLDDIPEKASGTSDDDISDDMTTYVIDPEIDPYDQLTSQPSIQTLAVASGNQTAYYQNWPGPFAQFVRFYGMNDPGNTISDNIDMPLDPWGTPYRFFSPIGIIGASADSTTYNSISYDDGRLTTLDDYYDFTGYAIVSAGKDKEFFVNTDSENDNIYMVFGRFTNESAYKPTF